MNAPKMSDEADAPSSYPNELLAAMDNLSTESVVDSTQEPAVAPPPAVETKTEPAKTPDAVKKEGEDKGDKAKADDSSKTEKDKISEEKPKSKYAQERERKERTWQEINAEKAAIQQAKEQLAKEREEAQRAAIKSQPYRDQHGNTAEAYEAFAKQAEAAGDKVNAEAAMKAAAEVRHAEVQAKAKAEMDDLNAQWRANYEKLVVKHPDLKDAKSPLYGEVAAMLNAHPVLTKHPQGIDTAVEAVLLTRKAKEMESISAENKALKEQIETLNKKLSLSSGVAAEPPKAEVEFDKLSRDEQFRQIERQITADPDWMNKL